MAQQVGNFMVSVLSRLGVDIPKDTEKLFDRDLSEEDFSTILDSFMEAHKAGKTNSTKRELIIAALTGKLEANSALTSAFILWMKNNSWRNWQRNRQHYGLLWDDFAKMKKELSDQPTQQDFFSELD